ncbi:hypothetical protein J2S74_002937 [Evansella vedderi]|uniref:Uncharacterized protein n=1 Tax=Evansella vedderi TaxID=38282 RepID=A0ABT9ZWF2_9BACI|nr:hypothetical protein [Evansella vedderi]MDQ0255555.1 hypothetical protein [Evansella vedderi]
MANRVHFHYKVFTNVQSSGQKTNEEEIGYTLGDDYGTTFNDTFGSIIELKDTVNLNNVLKYLSNHHHDFFVTVKMNGLYFNGEWYSIEELEELEQIESVPV